MARISFSSPLIWLRSGYSFSTAWTALVTWIQIFSILIWATFICDAKADTDLIFLYMTSVQTVMSELLQLLFLPEVSYCETLLERCWQSSCSLLRMHGGPIYHFVLFLYLFLQDFVLFLFSLNCFQNGEAKSHEGMDQGVLNWPMKWSRGGWGLSFLLWIFKSRRNISEKFMSETWSELTKWKVLFC